jgi:hypothetical protein
VGPVRRREAEEALIDAWEGPLEEGELTQAERAEAARLVEERYGCASWTNRR